MTEMRGVAEQISGLGLVAERLATVGIGSAIFSPVNPADVATLRTEHHGGIELVYASGGYDTWSTQPSGPLCFNLSLDEAVAVLAGTAQAAKEYV